MVDLDIINNNYEQFTYIENMGDVYNYSYISKVSTNIGFFYIKSVKNSIDYICLLEYVYGQLTDNDSINIPLLTKKNKFVCDDLNQHKYILLPEVDETNDVPSALWWADVLRKVHNIYIKDNNQFNKADFFSPEHKLYLLALKYMPKDIVNMIDFMLKLIKYEEKKNTSVVINHGDPLQSNVMKKNGKFVLIDFENVCIEPKEYDLQRHLWDFAVNSDKREIPDYYKSFIVAYKKYAEIDLELLHDLLILDFCRTICWLYVVCNDNCILDIERQKKELGKLVSSMRVGKIMEIIKCME